MKQKFRSYSFWLSLTGAVIIVLNNLGKAFNFSVDDKIISEIVNSICGVLIVLGVLTMPKNQDNKNNENSENLDDLKDENSDKSENVSDDKKSSETNPNNKNDCKK